MDLEMVKRIRKEANYIRRHSATIRQTAEKFNVSKTTVHTDMKRLRDIDLDLYYIVREVIKFNKSQRARRGGIAVHQNKK